MPLKKLYGFAAHDLNQKTMEFDIAVTPDKEKGSAFALPFVLML
ncbi:hypothetical protein ACFL0G_00955 [Candidatus Zixiibacteriota bacterium]